MPDCVGNAFVITGFCVVLLKLSGPVQFHVTPVESAVAKSLSVSPWQTGELLKAVADGGAGLLNVTLPAVSDVQLLGAVTVKLL